MISSHASRRLENLWDSAHAATLDEPGRLLYRSNLLGSDKRITNFGGGNTSAKVMHDDPLTGQSTEVLWVKGSGGDLGSMGLDGFSTLYLDKLETLKPLYRGREFEDEIGMKLVDEEDEEELDTLGGLVFMLAGRVPARGEVIKHPEGPVN